MAVYDGFTLTAVSRAPSTCAFRCGQPMLAAASQGAQAADVDVEADHDDDDRADQDAAEEEPSPQEEESQAKNPHPNVLPTPRCADGRKTRRYARVILR